MMGQDSQGPLLELRAVQKWYGEVHALRGVSLEINQSEIVGLIGDNGAGKSTLIKIISGVIPRDSGGIFWKGKQVSVRSVREAQALGIETVHQDRAVVGNMSVARNIFLGREPTRGIGPFRVLDRARMAREAEDLLQALKLHISSVDQEAGFAPAGKCRGWRSLAPCASKPPS